MFYEKDHSYEKNDALFFACRGRTNGKASERRQAGADFSLAMSFFHCCVQHVNRSNEAQHKRGPLCFRYPQVHHLVTLVIRVVFSLPSCAFAQVGIDIGFHVQTFLSKADMGVRMTGGNVAVMGDMVRCANDRGVRL